MTRRWMLGAIESADLQLPLILLLRHAERGPLPADDPGGDVPLLAAGRTAATALGAMLGNRLTSLRTSPVRRCVETARAIQLGAGALVAATADSTLGGPGLFVIEPEVAWGNWQSLGHEAVMAALVEGRTLAGMAEPREAARALVGHAIRMAGRVGGVHVLVTHDSILAATIAHTLGGALGPAEWPGFLEAFALVPHGNHIEARWRERRGVIRWT